MAGFYDGLEEIFFKRVDGGYLFEDTPWIVGRRRRYRVTDVQKAEIAARLAYVAQKLKPIAFSLAIGIPLLEIAVVAMLTRYSAITKDALVRDAMILAAAAVTIIVVSFHLYRRRMIKPLLVGLVPADGRIGLHEQFESFAIHASRKLLILFGITIPVSALISVVEVGTMLWYDFPVPLFMAALCAGSLLMLALFVYCLVLRARLTRGTRAVSPG